MSTTLTTAKAVRAVIFANEQNNLLYPYTDAPAPGLLPVLTKPILDYQIELLERSGFEQCILICHKKHEDVYASWIEDSKDAGNAFDVELLVTSEWSSGDALRELVKSKKFALDSDVLVLPSDLISTEPLSKFLAYHHYKRSAVTMMLIQQPDEPEMEPEKRSKSGKKIESKSTGPVIIDPRLDDPDIPLYIGLEEETNRLCLLRELDEENSLSFHKNILHSLSQFTLFTNFRSPSIYILSREALQLMVCKQNIDTFDLLAQFLVGMQFVQNENPIVNNNQDEEIDTTNTDKKKTKKDKNETSFLENNSCFAFIPPKTSLILRSDNMAAYTFLNKILFQPTLPPHWYISRPHNYLPDIQQRLLIEAKSATPEVEPAPTTPTPENGPQQGKGKAQKQNNKKADNKKPAINGWFGQESTWSEGTIISNSVIGRHCRIGKNAILKDCVLMDYVTVMDGAKVDSTIVGTRSSIAARAEVKGEAVPVETTEFGKSS
jgi:NDP-sugar pyrophosphorylase family protein